jgi:hypothetical protein
MTRLGVGRFNATRETASGFARARLALVCAVALGLGACGPPAEPKRPTPEIATEFPTTPKPASTVVAPTTIAIPSTTVIPSTVAFVEVTTTADVAAVTSVVTSGSVPIVESVAGLTAKDIEAVFAAALAAHDELQRQLVGPKIDRAELEKYLTPAYAKTTADYFEEERKKPIRYEVGTIDRRAVIAIEPREDHIIAIICFATNGPNINTKGTPTFDDDELIQAKLEEISYSVRMVKLQGTWYQDGSETGKDPRCAAFFS